MVLLVLGRRSFKHPGTFEHLHASEAPEHPSTHEHPEHHEAPLALESVSPYTPPVDREIEWVTEQIIGEAREVSPARLLFLVRRYPDAASPALHAALEQALSEGVRAFERDRAIASQCRWLGAFADAAMMVADDTLHHLVDAELPRVVDELEAVMRRVYEPGEGAMGHDAEDQVALTLALLVVFDLTARLPYAMLAEELFQTLNRTSWEEGAALFRASPRANARAAQIGFRLAALHRDPDYASRAVVAPNAAYDRIGAAVLGTLEPLARAHVDAVSEYGVALLDAFALNALPN